MPLSKYLWVILDILRVCFVKAQVRSHEASVLWTISLCSRITVSILKPDHFVFLNSIGGQAMIQPRPGFAMVRHVFRARWSPPRGRR